MCFLWKNSSALHTLCPLCLGSTVCSFLFILPGSLKSGFLVGEEQSVRLGLLAVFKGACAVFYQECTPQVHLSPDLFPRGSAALWTESLSILSVMVHRTGKPPCKYCCWEGRKTTSGSVQRSHNGAVLKHCNFIPTVSFLPYRYALICQQCVSHNGMALREEFEYTGETWRIVHAFVSVCLPPLPSTPTPPSFAAPSIWQCSISYGS